MLELKLSGAVVAKFVLELREHHYGSIDALPQVPPCSLFLIHGVEAAPLSGHRYHHRVGDAVEF